MPALSRRDFFARFIPKPDARVRPGLADSNAAKVAVIQGCHCLAYQNNFCSVCSERCPVPDAILTTHGIPRIVAEACTGCQICHEVCPAPTNAILMIPKK